MLRCLINFNTYHACYTKCLDVEQYYVLFMHLKQLNSIQLPQEVVYYVTRKHATRMFMRFMGSCVQKIEKKPFKSVSVILD